MKTITQIAALLLLFTVAASAQDTTRILIGGKTIMIIENNGKGNEEINVQKIIDSALKNIDSLETGGGEYDMDNLELEMEKLEDKLEHLDHDIEIGNKKGGDKSIAHWAGFEMGVNGWMNSDNSINLENSAYDLNYSNSLFVNLNIAEQKIPFFAGHGGLVTGLGFNFNHFAFKGNTQLDYNTDSTWTTTGNDFNYSKNKLNVTYLTLPLMLEFNTDLEDDHNFHIGFGVQGGFKLLAKTKQKYDFEGQGYKENVRGHYNINPWRADAVARIGYKGFTLFANYPLTQFFEEGTGPELYTFQVGVRLVDF